MVRLIEAKAGKTVTPRMAEPMQRLAAAFEKRRGRRVDMTIVHEAPDAGASISTVGKGVRALPWGEWARALRGPSNASPDS